MCIEIIKKGFTKRDKLGSEQAGKSGQREGGKKGDEAIRRGIWSELSLHGMIRPCWPGRAFESVQRALFPWPKGTLFHSEVSHENLLEWPFLGGWKWSRFLRQKKLIV